MAVSMRHPLVAAQGLPDSWEVLAHGLQGDTRGVSLSPSVRCTLCTPKVTHALAVVVSTAHRYALRSE